MIQSAFLIDFEVVLDDQDAAAVLNQPLKGIEQLCDVVEVQSGGGFVEDEERAFAGGVRQVRGELHALGLAAGKRGGRLAEP